MSEQPVTNESMHLCPWWLAYTFDNWIRRKIDPAEETLKQWVKSGMTVMDYGCGFGHYSIGAARIVGEKGLVVAVDLQEKMLEIMMKRADRSGVSQIIRPHKCTERSIDYSGLVDFAVATHVMHETPDLLNAFKEVYSILKPGGVFYFMEPRFHVSDKYFRKEITIAETVGFTAHRMTSLLLAHRAFLLKHR